MAICIPCASVQRLLDSGQFSSGLLPELCDNGTADITKGSARSLHNANLSFQCANFD